MSEPIYAGIVQVQVAHVLCPYCKIGRIDWTHPFGWRNELAEPLMPRKWRGYKLFPCPSCKREFSVRSTNRMRAP